MKNRFLLPNFDFLLKNFRIFVTETFFGILSSVNQDPWPEQQSENPILEEVLSVESLSLTCNDIKAKKGQERRDSELLKIKRQDQ